MRSLAARVRRIERTACQDRSCVCGGPWRASVIDDVGPPPHPHPYPYPAPPSPCPRCGTSAKWIVLMDDPGPGVNGEGLAGAVA